tara:strand:+ start:1060 stop:1668 length:609 start_codon:yes stop_codon:yes gene_type:complete
MNQVNIINKIPEDIVEMIISYICDIRGYNMHNYNKRKRENKGRMNRIIVELESFNRHYGMNIHKINRRGLSSRFANWAFYRDNNYEKNIIKNKIKKKEFLNNLKAGKPIINYHTGLYKTKNDEIIHTGYVENIYWNTHYEENNKDCSYLVLGKSGNKWWELRQLLRYLKGGRIDDDDYLEKKAKRRRRSKRRKLMRRKRLKR